MNFIWIIYAYYKGKVFIIYFSFHLLFWGILSHALFGITFQQFSTNNKIKEAKGWSHLRWRLCPSNSSCYKLWPDGRRSWLQRYRVVVENAYSECPAVRSLGPLPDRRGVEQCVVEGRFLLCSWPRLCRTCRAELRLCPPMCLQKKKENFNNFRTVAGNHEYK